MAGLITGLLGTFVLFIATADGRAAKQNLPITCMDELLESYGIPPNRTSTITQRMVAKRFDEVALRVYSGNNLFLRFNLLTFGLSSEEVDRVMTCAHIGTGAKSPSCKQTPCGVRGTCAFSKRSRKQYVCDCQAGYSGTHCEKDLCSPSPCDQNATCYHTARGFYCDCPRGYTGRLCDKTVNECASSPCQNSGTCVDGILNYKCKCPFGYDGINCDNKWFIATHYEKLEQMVHLQQAQIQKQQAQIQKLAEIESLAECKLVRGVINWRQKAAKLSSNSENAQLVSMPFRKKRNNTHLRLTWSSNMRQQNYNKCGEWYFTIDSHECTNPATINGVIIYNAQSGNHFNGHRHGTIIGVCRGTSAGNIQAGNHNIAMHVRDCPGTSGSDSYTGWASTTIMLVEELCPPQ